MSNTLWKRVPSVRELSSHDIHRVSWLSRFGVLMGVRDVLVSLGCIAGLMFVDLGGKEVFMGMDGSVGLSRWVDEWVCFNTYSKYV